MKKDDVYSLDRLIEILREIKENGTGAINYAKAALTVALELKYIKDNNPDMSWCTTPNCKCKETR